MVQTGPTSRHRLTQPMVRKMSFFCRVLG